MSAESSQHPRRGLIAGLLALAVLLGTLGLVGLFKSHDLRDGEAAQNQALVEPAVTSDVEGEVSTALARVLTYDYKKPAATNAAAEQYLVGDAKEQYATLFDALREKAKDQQLTYEAEVVTAGVKSLEGDDAELLVFLDQRSVRATDNASTIAAAQIAISAVKQDGAWKISGINPI